MLIMLIGEVYHALTSVTAFLKNSDYCVLNDGSPTFHKTAHSSNSVIDLAIIHESLTRIGK